MFARLTSLAEHRREIDALEAAWHDELAEYHHSDEWRADNFASSASALGSACRMDPGVAQGHVNLARKLEKLPDIADAFRCGEISARHAAVVASAYTTARAAELSTVENRIADIARTETPSVLGQVVRRFTDAIDGDGGADAEEAKHKRRRLHASRSIDDMLNVNGLFDPEAADIIEKAIEAELQRDHRADDDRDMGQRRADAFTNVLRQSLNQGELGTEHGAAPHVTYIVHADEHPGSTPELIDLIRTDRRTYGHVSTTTLERIMCDCNLTRVVMSGRSEILDVGRATRTATGAQWKALVIRDGHCQAPGCRQPPNRCEAHHRTPWGPPHHGKTDLDNLELLCWHHHREKHKHGHDAQARAA